MNAQEFRDALADLGLSQSAFGRLLKRYGHQAKDPARSVRRWAASGAMSEAAVILNVLRQARDNGADLAATDRAPLRQSGQPAAG